MLGYTMDDFYDMRYAVQTADLIINSDENPAIHNHLVKLDEFLAGLYEEGYFNDLD